MAYLLSAKHRAGAPRHAALLAVPVMFGAAASAAWSFDVVYAESNSTAGNSILSFENDGSGALRFLCRGSNKAPYMPLVDWILDLKNRLDENGETGDKFAAFRR